MFRFFQIIRLLWVFFCMIFALIFNLSTNESIFFFDLINNIHILGIVKNKRTNDKCPRWSIQPDIYSQQASKRPCGPFWSKPVMNFASNGIAALMSAKAIYGFVQKTCSTLWKLLPNINSITLQKALRAIWAKAGMNSAPMCVLILMNAEDMYCFAEKARRALWKLVANIYRPEMAEWIKKNCKCYKSC